MQGYYRCLQQGHGWLVELPFDSLTLFLQSNVKHSDYRANYLNILPSLRPYKYMIIIFNSTDSLCLFLPFYSVKCGQTI